KLLNRSWPDPCPIHEVNLYPSFLLHALLPMRLSGGAAIGDEPEGNVLPLAFREIRIPTCLIATPVEVDRAARQRDQAQEQSEATSSARTHRSALKAPKRLAWQSAQGSASTALPLASREPRSRRYF